MKDSNLERRSHERFHVREKIILYNGSTFAEVLNISKGGLLCRYLIDTEEASEPVDVIDLIDSPGKVFLQKIPCDDLNYQTGIRELFGSTAIRDCRLKFVHLDPEEERRLAKFIDSVKVTASQQ